jgi:periplasmic copper chaperone A
VSARIRIAAACLIAALIAVGAGIAVLSEGGGSSSPSSPITVTDQYVTATTNDVAALYFTIKNNGPEDTLLGVTTDASDSASLHRDVVNGGSASMQLLQDLTVPAGGQLVFKAGGNHVMVEGIQNGLDAGQSVNVTLTFQKAGKLTFVAPVKGRE